MDYPIAVEIDCLKCYYANSIVHARCWKKKEEESQPPTNADENYSIKM